MKKVGLGFSIMALTACSFAPKYERPAMPIPMHYKETEKWKSTTAKSKTDKCGYWWRLFQDPALNILEDKVTAANQNLKVAYAHYFEALAAVQVARSAYYPTVLGIGNADRQKESTTMANPVTVPLFNNFLIGAELSYEVDLWGRVRNAVAVSEHNAQASAADRDAVALSLHTQLALDYFMLRGNEATQRVLDATVAAYKKGLYLTRKRHEGGAAPIADVYQAITQLENAKTQATETHLQHAQLEHAIAVLVGEIPANFCMPPIKSSKPFKFIDIVSDLPSILLERRPDIASAEQHVQAANAQIGVARAAFFPTFNLISLLGFQSQTLAKLISKPSLLWSLGPSSMLSLTQPMTSVVLFDGGNLRGLLNSAKASYLETVATYRQTVLTAFQEVEDSLVAIKRLDQENISQKTATFAAEHSLIQEKNRYIGGIVTYLEVIISENIALQSEIAYINIRTRRQLASVQLIKALGGGWQPIT